MASPEKISTTEMKKISLQRAILSLLVEWMDFEEPLYSIHQPFESGEKNLVSVEESVSVSNKERLKQVEQLNLIRKLAEDSINEIELREKRLNAQQKLMEGILGEIVGEQKQFEAMGKSISERLVEMKLKEEYLENCAKELDLRRAELLDIKVENVKERVRRFYLKENEMESIIKLSEERSQELETKEKQLDFAQKFIEERAKELESKQKQLDDRFMELELKENQFCKGIHSRVKAEQLEDNCSSVDIRSLATMDGKNLQLFLNEREKDHLSMADEVSKALRLSMDPAKLVLDAMEGFYPPHLKKGNIDFEGSVVRRTCILLLEQVMRISPHIQPDVKEAALRVAGEWKAKIRLVVENSLEVLGFLHLLAAYKLGGDFDADELLSLFKIVPPHRQTLELCRLLGFTYKIVAMPRKRTQLTEACEESQPASQPLPTRVTAKWTDERTECLLDCLIVEKLAGNMPQGQFTREAWTRIVLQFRLKSGKHYNKIQVRNRFDILRSSWRLWTSIMRTETDTRWDHKTGTISADEGWWQQKIAKAPGAIKFRDKGMPCWDKMSQVFRGSMASNEYVWTPSSGQMHPYMDEEGEETTHLAEEGEGEREETILQDHGYACDDYTPNSPTLTQAIMASTKILSIHTVVPDGSTLRRNDCLQTRPKRRRGAGEQLSDYEPVDGEL